MIYNAPDIYIEEVAGGARPIQAVGTSTAAFIGEAPDPTAPHNQPIACNNWTQFVKIFAANQDAQSTPLANAVFGFFQNGGSRCYVVAIAKDKPLIGQGKQRAGLDLLEQVNEVAIVAAPGYTDLASHSDLLAHCEKMKDRVAILDGPEQVDDIAELTIVATIVPAGTVSTDAKSAPSTGRRPPISRGGYGAFYYPWITIRDAFSGELINTAPSGHIAGIWARTDFSRGVHKAPANEVIRGALAVTHLLTSQEQAVLNPSGVNCLRYFTQEGILVWGARTVAEGSSEWRYLNVRRLFSMIEESIASSTRWIVFEPNDRTLWKSIRRDVSAFLTQIWRDGALMGRTPAEAFFVKCDEETNPKENIDAGIVTAVIGIAPVKPAEFIVFRISQYDGGTEVETQGVS